MFLQILPAALVALAIAAALSAVALFCRSERLREILVPFALGVAYCCGHFFITGWTSFPPTDTTNWLPYFALAVAAFGSVLRVFRSTTLRIVVSGFLGIAALRLLLAPKFRYGWSFAQGWMWVDGLTLLVLLLALSLIAIGRRSSVSFEPTGLLLIVCAGAAGALTLSGSLLLGQFGAILAAAVLGTLVLAFRGIACSEGIALCFSLLLIALLASGYFFAELPSTSALLLATAPAFALLPTGKAVAHLAVAIRMVFVSVPVAIALLVAFRSSPPLIY